MIHEIYIDKIASYKKPVTLSLKNKISLIYGLNGAGKSTISNYLYKSDDAAYSFWKIKKDLASEILVYNQLFLDDNFYIADSLKGIFSLSKVNKDVLASIESKNLAKNALQVSQLNSNSKIIELDNKLENAKQTVIDKIWDIKIKYTGGDRVFEYCLEGLKRKENLFEHLTSIEIIGHDSKDTIDQLKKELNSISDNKASIIPEISNFEFSGLAVEENDLFNKVITGSEEGPVAQFINTIGNSDWVRNGLKYVATPLNDENSICPFCQESTLNHDLIHSIKSVFDGAFEDDVNALDILKINYVASESELIFQPINESLIIENEILQNWKSFVFELKTNYRENKLLIDKKIQNLSSSILLKSNKEIAKNINDIILKINAVILEHNTKIANKKSTLINLKNRFWILMRAEFDRDISVYKRNETEIEILKIAEKNEFESLTSQIGEISHEITHLNSQTLNIEEAVASINNALAEIGITGFSIKKYKNDLYRIERSDTNTDAFLTLSEGEKTVISFLYFLELCKGKRSAIDNGNKKIIVIDDPISSLSHIYVFNIGQLIKSTFFNSNNFEQIFVLTHSLYFFYELTHTNKDKRAETQNLFRVIKNKEGSNIIEMKYDEIQNDYQTYWSIIKDESSQPALIANCMRNIIEYFFNFVEKNDFNNVFQKPTLSDNKYQAFSRYMNRESHSLGQNIFDIKEFNYDVFKEGLHSVFKECGYEKHYAAMMK